VLPAIETRRDKLYRAEIKSVDEDKGTVTAVVSSEKKDRDGDIIRVAGWDLKEFLEHPVLLSSHNYRSLLNQIGEWTDIKVIGKRLVGTAQYMIGKGNAEADWGFELAKIGMAAYSVAFIPDMEKAEMIDGSDDWWPSWEFNGQQLLEVSAVTIPSNPDALQRAKTLMTHPVLAELVDEALEDEGITKADVIRLVDVDGVAELLVAAIMPKIVAEFRSLARSLIPGETMLTTEVDKTLKEKIESWHQN
tara:strand:- start:2298 stop:3041 length:744 start_codon:yes stop_codon:yes gene_type:complete